MLQQWRYLLLLLAGCFTQLASSMLTITQAPPVLDLLRRVDRTTCGTHTDTSLDCCQSQGPFFCPVRFGTCFTSDGYLGCCSREGGCAPRTTCYPHSALQSCDPDTGGCTACTNIASPECVLETNVLANQYLLYCNTAATTITHSYLLDQAELNRENSEKASRISVMSAAAAAGSTVTLPGKTATVTAVQGIPVTISGSGSSPASRSTMPGPTSTSSSDANASSDESKDNDSKGSNRIGSIVGGVIGGLVFAVLLVVLALFGIRRYQQRKPLRSDVFSTSSMTDSSSSAYRSHGMLDPASPFAWRSASHEYHPVDHPYTSTPYRNSQPRERWNGSPGPFENILPYSHRNYGDVQHPGYHPIGPLTVRNSAPSIRRFDGDDNDQNSIRNSL